MSLEALKHKKRTVADLIRFIGNTAETESGEVVKTPNYSLLLGAGASVTSGVRSGQALVREWKQQVFEESPHNEDMTLEEFYTPGNAPTWYEESNCYSALFENRFDLQRHRRIFVEREVSKAKPSMGYAYLVKLIENGFFNTVFTTNFDDLINEAFYRFSKNRPIVCAHDSSISGVTVTSTRPKIIKLHGDYLFENIKATLRETESLETNMKMKFQEFAKDFGLIVIGYSGQDRSIMDILNYLLQKEDYFKNGIFWCIRKGDTCISSELKKLLWRDRVYYVEIDGFDEFLAELNHQLNKGALPVDDTFLSRKHQENIIRELTDNPLMNPSGKCKILVDDCKKLKYNFEDNMLNDYLSYLKKKQNDSKKADVKNARRKIKLKEMTAEEKKEIDDLMTEGFVLKHTNSVLQKLSKMEIASLEDGQYKLELMELKADLTKNMNDESIKNLFEELIRLDPDNQRYYEISANRSKSHIQAIRFLNMAVDKYPNDAYIINKLIERLLDYCEEECPAEKSQEVLDKIQDLNEKSLKLKPQIENDAYSYKYRYLQIRYRNLPQEFRKERNKLCEELIAVSKCHPQTLSIMRKVEHKNLDEDYFMQAIDFYKKADNCRNVEKCFIEYIGYECDKGHFDNVIKLFKEYESEYVASNSFKFVKARVLMEKEYFEDALIILNDLPLDEEVTRRKMMILLILGRDDEMDSLYEASDYKDILKPYYLSLKERYQEERDYYENKFNEKENLTVTEAVSYAYVMLHCEDYQAVKKLLKPYYDNPILAEGSVIVNYLFARKKSGDDIASKLKAKMIENKYQEFSDFEKLGAYCVLGDKENAYNCLLKVIKKEPMQKYSISKWPVLAPFKEDEKYRKILKPDHKRLGE